MSADSRLPGLSPKTAADLQRARKRIPWVDDDDLRALEEKSLAGTAALSVFTWGGGHLYVGETLQGMGFIGALLLWLTVSGALGLPAAIFFVVSVTTAILSVRKAKQVNRFVSTRNELALQAGPDASAYRLLAAAAKADPGLAAALPPAPSRAGSEVGADGQDKAASPHAELIDRLRKLVALHRAGVLSDVELHDRKLDLLQEAAPATRKELDDLLYALLPLAGEAVLDEDDFAFLKEIGGTSS